MSEANETTFEAKCEILGQLWVDYKGDEEFSDFITYNDMGLPLAFLIASDIVQATPKAEGFVNETFELLLTALGHEEDSGFDSLEDLLSL